MKASRYIIYCVLILAVIGLFCYYAFWEKDLSSTNILKVVLILAGIIADIVKSAKGTTPANKKVFYQKAYGEFLQGAFAEDPKLEKKLYSAVHDFGQSRFSHALSKLEKLRPHCQRTADIYAVTVFQGLCCDDLGLFQAAADYYRAAAGMKRNTTVSSNLGLCLQKLGKFEDAEKAYREAVAIDPGNTYSLNNLSVLYFRRGEYETSLELSRQVLEIDSGMVQALSNAALCCAVTGRQEEYEDFYNRAVSNGYDGRKIKNFLANMAAADPEE